MPNYNVVRTIYQLLEEGNLKIEDSISPTSLSAWLKSHYGLKLWTIMAFILITAFSVYLLPLNSPLVFIRYVFGIVFLLFLPGYSLTDALYPNKNDLEELERLALSIGLSLALVPLTGLVLNYTPWGVRLDPLLISLASITFILTLIGTLRKFWNASKTSISGS